MMRSIREIERDIEYERTHRMDSEELAYREKRAGFFGAYTQEAILRKAPRNVRANLRRARDPRWSGIKMDRQYFVGLAAEPPTLNPLAAAITATSETAMWAPAQFTPIPAFEAVGGRVYELLAGGIFSTSTSGTLIITPRYGLVIGGVSLGPSITQTVVVSLSAESWFMHGMMTVRAVGISASTGTCTLNGFWQGGGAAATAASGIDISFGGLVPTTCDTSTAQGLWVGWTLSVAGSCTPQQVVWRRMN